MLFLWLTNRFSRNTVNHPPAQLAATVASDMGAQLAHDPALQVDLHLRSHYGRAYQPFAVALRDGRAGSNRPAAAPQLLIGSARRHLLREDRNLQDRGVRVRRFFLAEEFADIELDGAVVGVVAVPSVPPPVFIGLWELAPTLTWVGLTLLGIGAGATALLVFRLTHKRLRTLEEAARALGEGRTDVRASVTGGDEVTALARTFNRMADDLHSRASALGASDRARRQLLADVSHELMTPLSAIRATSRRSRCPS